jgi:peptidoglycan glycosyltransferase
VNKELRRVSVVVVLMFLALFVSTSVIQVFAVDGLKSNQHNVRVLYDSYSTERGEITVDGVPIAQSQAVDDNYSFLRVYSNGALYAPITGYVSLNHGNAGLERSLNEELSGTSDAQFLDQINALITGQKPKGASVELTIDPIVQQAAWDALGDNTGSIVAIDPKTGAILAMVSKSSYDPNVLSAHESNATIDSRYDELLANPSDPLINRAIGGDLYHPGSVFKIVMTAAALEGGDYTPDSEFPNPGQLQLPGTNSVISNAEGGSCGGGATASIATALRLSCNIPFAQLGAAMGEDRIREMAESFGFGQSVAIPMASTPSIYPQGMDVPQLMLSSFGQFDDKVTPLQMAMVSAAIANGGVLMNPTLVESITSPDLRVIQQLEPTVFSTPVSPAVSATMVQMLVNGVSNGAASNARISGVDVAGKTGTAENGEGEAFTLWFTGFAPANDPQVAIAVVVENGGGLGQNAFGNKIAAPMAKKVLEAVLNR